MAALGFEMKKIWSSKFYLVLITLSCVMVFQAIGYLSSNVSNEYERINHIDNYEQSLLMELLDSKNFSPGQLSKGAIHYNKIFEDPNYEQRESILGHQVSPFKLIVQYIQGAYSIDGREMSVNQKQMIDYLSQVERYMARYKLNQPPKPFLYEVVKVGDILFGIIPIIVINLFFLKLYDDDLKANHVFLSILPISLKKNPLNKVFSGLSLLLLYFFITVGIMWGLSEEKGLHLFYPVRSIISPSTIVPLYLVLILTLFLFILRSLLFMAMGVMIFMISKRINYTIMIQSILICLLIYVAKLVGTNNHFLTPIIIDHQGQLLGHMSRIYLEGRWLTEFSGNFIRGSSLVGYLAILIFMIFLQCQYFPIYCQIALESPTKKRKHKKFQSMTAMELHKNWRGNKLFQVLGIFCFILMLFVGHILIGDFYRKSQPYLSPSFTEDYGFALKYYSNVIEELRIELADLDPNDTYTRQAYEVTIENRKKLLGHYEILNSQYLARKDALENKDIEKYIANLNYEMMLHYNPEGKLGMDEDSFAYVPRPNYYIAGDFPSGFGFSLSQARLIELKERGIAPLGGEGILYNYLDRPVVFLNEISDRLTYQVADHSFLGLLSRLFLVYRIDIIIIALILFLAIPDFSLEGKRGSHESLLFTLPISTKCIYTSKFKASVITGSLFFLIVVFVCFLVGLIFRNFGNMNYPFYHFIESEKYIWLDHWVVVCLTIIFFYLNMIFIINVSLILSFWIRSVVTKSLIILGTVFILFKLSIAYPTVGRFSPFAYVNMTNILDGTIFQRFLHMKSSLLFPILVLVIWNILFYLCGLKLIKFIGRRSFK